MLRHLLLAALIAVPAIASAQPKRKIKDIVQPVKIEKVEPPDVVAENLTSAIRAHDAKRVAEVLNHRVLVRGMWFPDAACTKKFAKQKTIAKGEVTAFAKCLAKLELQDATRKSQRTDRVLLTYAPGIEMEGAIANGRLYYLSYVHTKPSSTPTLTAQTFEALRTDGTKNVDAVVATKLDPELAKRTHHVAAWIEICLDAKGAVKATVTEATTPEIGAVFAAATADWKFTPFMRGKTAMPVCSQTLLSYPAAKAPAVELLPDHDAPYIDEVNGEDVGVEGGVEGGEAGGEWVPGVGYADAPPPPPPPPPPAPPQNVQPMALEAQRIAGDRVIVPDPKTKDEIIASAKDKIVGSFKLCVNVTGAVSTVSILKTTGFPAYDMKLMREMRQWAYRPYQVNGKAVPVCTAVTFIYSTK